MEIIVEGQHSPPPKLRHEPLEPCPSDLGIQLQLVLYMPRLVPFGDELGGTPVPRWGEDEGLLRVRMTESGR